MSDYIHKEFPKTCDPKDFWGQVKRSVNGKPIEQDQIDLIVKSVSGGLCLDKGDNLLDVGCGNGALSFLFFDKVKKLVGVDFSEYLISVAIKNFENRPNYSFHLGDAHEFVEKYGEKSEITKVLCYGVFPYFEKQIAENLLILMSKQYRNLTRVYIGNIPDKDRAGNFFYNNIDYAKLLEDPKGSTGTWWTKSEIQALATNCGWKIEINQMPDNFYAAHYRYDVVLTK